MKSRRFWILLLVAGLLTGLYLTRAAVLPAVASWLDVGQPPQRADAIMLLTGDVETRPFAAAVLWKAGWAPRVLVTMVASRPEKEFVPPEHELNLRVLRACGVPAEDIVLLQGQAVSTRDEAQALAEHLAAAPGQRLLVVTNGYHTRRARWILNRLLGSRAARITLISVRPDEFPPETWWQDEKGFSVILGEYLKLGFYGLRYGRLGYELAAGILLWLAWLAHRRRRLAPVSV
jgi:uncharacterized SAM-binding protein YcdF (DUF218 family)